MYRLGLLSHEGLSRMCRVFPIAVETAESMATAVYSTGKLSSVARSRMISCTLAGKTSKGNPVSGTCATSARTALIVANAILFTCFVGSSMALLLTFIIVTIFYSGREYLRDLFLGIEVTSAHLVFLDDTFVLLSPESRISDVQHVAHLFTG